MDFLMMFLKMAPMIIAIIKEIDAVIPGSGNGPAKLDLLQSTVNTAVQSSPSAAAAAVQGHDLNGAVSNLASITVKALKQTGSSPTQGQPAPSA